MPIARFGILGRPKFPSNSEDIVMKFLNRPLSALRCRGERRQALVEQWRRDNAERLREDRAEHSEYGARADRLADLRKHLREAK